MTKKAIKQAIELAESFKGKTILDSKVATTGEGAIHEVQLRFTDGTESVIFTDCLRDMSPVINVE